MNCFAGIYSTQSLQALPQTKAAVARTPLVAATRASVIPSSPAELLRRYSNGADAGTRTAVLERPVEAQPPRNTDPARKYRVILFNDSTHQKSFVVKVLMKTVPELTMGQAKAIADKAASSGKAIVGTWIFELAEMYADLLNSNGLRSDIVQE